MELARFLSAKKANKFGSLSAVARLKKSELTKHRSMIFDTVCSCHKLQKSSNTNFYYSNDSLPENIEDFKVDSPVRKTLHRYSLRKRNSRKLDLRVSKSTRSISSILNTHQQYLKKSYKQFGLLIASWLRRMSYVDAMDVKRKIISLTKKYSFLQIKHKA